MSGHVRQAVVPEDDIAAFAPAIDRFGVGHHTLEFGEIGRGVDDALVAWQVVVVGNPRLVVLHLESGVQPPVRARPDLERATIVLVDRVNRLRLEGMERRAAVIAGAHQRFRPIVMTTTTTVLGLLPMAIGLGEAAELRTPMAITVIGGLLIATFLTLVVIPVVYDLVDRKKIHGDVFEGGESPT